MGGFFESILEYLLNLQYLEALGLVFGVLAVVFLIKGNIWTWPAGIAYVLVSFVIFAEAKLYADFTSHVVFLILNVYGWWYWINGSPKEKEELPISTTPIRTQINLWVISVVMIFLAGLLLNNYTDAALPYWDSATTILSFVGMWLTAKKKIENWHYWLIVDILATGIYFYKELYFYSFLYFLYIGMAVAGFVSWKKTMNNQTPKSILV